MLKLNDEMINVITLQRTWLAKCKASVVPVKYSDSCQNDFVSIQKAIPRRSAGAINILDIGAGLGGIDVLLYEYYKTCKVEPYLWLLDRDMVDAHIVYGYSSTPSAYNQQYLTERFLQLNNIPTDVFNYVTAYPRSVKFDLVISFISCGFHYPLSKYLDSILQSIHKKTVLIFDIRKGSNQFDLLHNTFGWVNCLQVTEKYKRVVCRL